MKLIIDIPIDNYKHIQEEQWLPNRLLIEKAIANGTPIPDNATNGDCVRKLFCKGIYRTSVRTNVSVEFKRDWWNAPYRQIQGG